MSPGGMRPAAMSSAVTVSSTIWKVSLAVWPMTLLSFSGSLSPGASMTMRSWPWRAIDASLVPMASMRRLMISRFWSTALNASCCIAWSERARWMCWSPALVMVMSRPPLGSGSPRFWNSLKAVSSWAGSVIRTSTTPPTRAGWEAAICFCCSVFLTSSVRLVSFSAFSAAVSTS